MKRIYWSILVPVFCLTISCKSTSKVQQTEVNLDQKAEELLESKDVTKELSPEKDKILYCTKDIGKNPSAPEIKWVVYSLTSMERIKEGQVKSASIEWHNNDTLRKVPYQRTPDMPNGNDQSIKPYELIDLELEEN